MSTSEAPDGIRSLTVENFTVFPKATLDFADLNVIVGENGAGKTHLLRLLYAALVACQRPGGQPATEKDRDDGQTSGNQPTINTLEPALSAKLVGVFNPQKRRVGRLVRRRQGHNTCSVKVDLRDFRKSIGFGFSTRSSKVNVTTSPSVWHDATSVFLPTHELLSIPEEFVWLYDRYATEFDEAWYDTRKLLGAPKLQGRQGADITKLSSPLKDTLGGKMVYNKSDKHFYLHRSDGILEMPLVAEGLRKVGTLWYLATAGHLTNTNCLFWDEPESNLNPKIIRTVAEAISHISRAGTQVFIATHSLFLIKELELIQRKHGKKRYLRYFALERKDDGVDIHPADDIYDIEPLVALDVANDQSQRFISESKNW